MYARRNPKFLRPSKARSAAASKAVSAALKQTPQEGATMMVKAEYFDGKGKRIAKTYVSELKLKSLGGIDYAVMGLASRCRVSAKAERFRFTFINETMPFFCGSV